MRRLPRISSATTAQETFEAVDTLGKLDPRSYRPARGASYPQSPLGQSLRQIAMLVKAEVGLEVAFAETGGWDTHVLQGTANGTFGRCSRDLAASIRAFWTDLGEPTGTTSPCMTMTEFGRTVARERLRRHRPRPRLVPLRPGPRRHRQPGPRPPPERSTPTTSTRDATCPSPPTFAPSSPKSPASTSASTDDSAMFPGWSGGRLPLLIGLRSPGTGGLRQATSDETPCSRSTRSKTFRSWARIRRRKRSGAGASRGLQNRSPASGAARGVGSIPMRFRHLFPVTWLRLRALQEGSLRYGWTGFGALSVNCFLILNLLADCENTRKFVVQLLGDASLAIH